MLKIPALGLIGGIPLGILRDASLDRIPARLQEIVPPLLATGRYIPLAGGRVRAGVSWAAYDRYREVLGEMLGAAGPAVERVDEPRVDG